MDLLLNMINQDPDLVLNGNDLAMVNSFQTMIPVALFGGNVEASTPITRLESEQDFSWWGNALLFPNEPDLQFNSLTERTLGSVALNSSGRILIEEAVKKDLGFMNDFATVSVSASITATDRVQIAVTVTERGNIEEKEFIYIWDAAKQEITENE